MHLAVRSIRARIRLVTIALTAPLLLAPWFAATADDPQEPASAAVVEEADAAVLDDADVADEFAAAELPPRPTVREAAAVAEDELWFVSSRRARCSPDGVTGLTVWKYAGEDGWQTSNVEALAAAAASLPTCFHIHGNRVSYSQSNCGGWQFYHRLVDGAAARKPLRFVIFAWPSDRIAGSQRDDVRAKAVVAECHAYYLASLVDRFPPQARVSFVGYSFGARLAGGSLHLLGGGTVRGRTLERTTDEPRHTRAVFLAGALDSGHFAPGRGFQMAPSQLDYLLVSRNPADRVLKWYPALYRFTLRPAKTGPQAMGYVGLSGVSCLPELRYEYVNVSCQVGNNHDWHGLDYCHGRMLERMRTCIAFAPMTDEPTAVVQTAAK